MVRSSILTSISSIDARFPIRASMRVGSVDERLEGASNSRCTMMASSQMPFSSYVRCYGQALVIASFFLLDALEIRDFSLFVLISIQVTGKGRCNL